MTSSEKAQELFTKMNGFRISYAHRVKCAKIVCDEIKRYCEFDSTKEFYDSVKLELDKLGKKK